MRRAVYCVAIGVGLSSGAVYAAPVAIECVGQRARPETLVQDPVQIQLVIDEERGTVEGFAGPGFVVPIIRQTPEAVEYQYDAENPEHIVIIGAIDRASGDLSGAILLGVPPLMEQWFLELKCSPAGALLTGK